ncbi:MAG: sulfatase-like hydrolase/transferase [Bacteroidota bacterium]
MSRKISNNLNAILIGCLGLLLFSCNTEAKEEEKKPNILWLLTDDQRYDAIPAFNRILHNRDSSALGYVESPNVDRLSEVGTTFINTYCQAAGCAPSRASMHLGRYPFRSGIYEFEYHNNKAKHTRPTLPEQMADLGYQTVHIGKRGVRLKSVDDSGKTGDAKIYQQSFYFKDLRKDGLTDWDNGWASEIDGVKLDEPLRKLERFVSPDGEFQYISTWVEENFPKHKGTAVKVMKEYDLLRKYNDRNPKSDFKGMVLAGVSPQPAGKTRDGYYSSIFVDFLNQPDTSFNVGSKTYTGVDTSKPLFCHIGYDFPHTPVLPPADYRERFQKYNYQIPEFNEEELQSMAAQQRNQVLNGYTDHFSDEEKLKMIQDYYAFCAYGDRLIGQAVDAFIDYSTSQNQPWMIVYVCGDHGWKLNDHGSVSKFSSWDVDTHNPIVVVSSDKEAFPAGKVVRNYTEFVDIAPTIIDAGGGDLAQEKFDFLDGQNLEAVAEGSAPLRDYIVGECHAVTGPRAWIRTEDYVFSVQTRPNKNRGENMDWALNATYQELDPALYHTSIDPNETNNVAFDNTYEEVAMKMKEKLLNIVLGDNRVEVGWGKQADGTEIYRSNFAPGAHDYKLSLK